MAKEINPMPAAIPLNIRNKIYKKSFT